MKLVLFSKMFQEMPMEKLADFIASLKLDGVDLTVRPGGYIEPKDVKRKLPDAVEIFASRGLQVAMVTTSIVSADEPYAEETFSAAADLGVKYVKLGYWHYRGFGHLWKQIEEARENLKGIERLCKEYNLTAGVHTHSGMFLTAEAAVVRLLLEGFDPEYVGAYIDPGHMVVEGGLAGWLMGMDLLSDRITIVAVKDFGWFKTEKGWVARVIPLGEGLVPWEEVFKILKSLGFEGPVSLHSEYEEVGLSEIAELTRRDAAYVKEILRRIK
ncbi:MAG: sugar phosphate isomerase/epimerase family protein [Thermofilaceae archaeon]